MHASNTGGIVVVEGYYICLPAVFVIDNSKNSISVLWYNLNVHLYPHDDSRHNPANAYLKSGSLSVTASMAPTAECGEWSALSSSRKLITRTISMEFESRSKRLMRAMTSFRSRMSWGMGLLPASHPSSWNKIFSEVAIPARTYELIQNMCTALCPAWGQPVIHGY